MDGTSNVILAPFTTLRIGGPADVFYEVVSIDDLRVILRTHSNEHITVLGGGSNVLVSDAGVRGVIIRMTIPGIVYESRGTYTRAIVGAGEGWDAFVADTLAHGFSGLENLSGIPGSVGASPVQNIGAYGTEVREHIESVEVFDTTDGTLKSLSSDDCAFGYRDSIFKSSEGKKYIVTRVIFSLTNVFRPNTAYKDIESFFSKKESGPHSAQDVRDAVLAVRRTKFPDLSKEGTAGSFFKNPLISNTEAQTLVRTYPGMPVFPAGDDRTKIPLGWILEHVLHIKGVREGNVSMFEHHALVLVAHKGATAHDVDMFARGVEKKVFDATGITIEREVCTLS